jgi:hypothetical protein
MVDASPRMAWVILRGPPGLVLVERWSYPYVTDYQAAGREDGLVLRSHWERTGEVWLEVVHAEPRAKFSGLLLRKVADGEALPFTEVDKVEVGGVIRIRVGQGSVGGTSNLVYVITEHLDHDIYAGCWPD